MTYITNSEFFFFFFFFFLEKVMAIDFAIILYLVFVPNSFENLKYCLAGSGGGLVLCVEPKERKWVSGVTGNN